MKQNRLLRDEGQEKQEAGRGSLQEMWCHATGSLIHRVTTCWDTHLAEGLLSYGPCSCLKRSVCMPCCLCIFMHCEGQRERAKCNEERSFDSQPKAVCECVWCVHSWFSICMLYCAYNRCLRVCLHVCPRPAVCSKPNVIHCVVQMWQNCFDQNIKQSHICLHQRQCVQARWNLT